MGTKRAPIDSVERELATAQLDELAFMHEGEPWTAWKDVVLDWHLSTLADARAQAWIPGLATSQDPIVEKALSRFHRHQAGVVINRLKRQNLELRQRLLGLLDCARYYASGLSDSGQRARATLKTISASAETSSPHRTNFSQNGSSPAVRKYP